MTTFDRPFAAGTPCWVDLMSSDVDASKEFYSGLFGWTFEDPGPRLGGYGNFRSDGHNVAGMGKNPGQGIPDLWSTYFAVDDLEATVAAASQAGAQVVAPVMAMEDLGSMAMLTDPAQAVFGVWQAGAHTGFTKANEPGSVSWNEHHSKDFPASTPFYADLFRWQLEPVSDTDEFRYFVANLGGRPVAGLMDSASFLPPEVPSHWTVYFSVADVDSALSDLTGLGGKILRPAEDSAYGRIADVADTTGASFRLHSPMLSDGTDSRADAAASR